MDCSRLPPVEPSFRPADWRLAGSDPQGGLVCSALDALGEGASPDLDVAALGEGASAGVDSKGEVAWAGLGWDGLGEGAPIC
jgi:hypothetical protein